MRIFLDTEFAEYNVETTATHVVSPFVPSLDLISIGMVDDIGRELHLVNIDFDQRRCNDWVKKNVLPHLPPYDAVDTFGRSIWCAKSVIVERIKAWITAGGSKPEFWAWYSAYDWVLFCWLFGTMQDLPEGYPMCCYDLKQYAYHLGILDSLKTYVPQPTGEHDALCDARWNQAAFNYLKLIECGHNKVPK